MILSGRLVANLLCKYPHKHFGLDRQRNTINVRRRARVLEVRPHPKLNYSPSLGPPRPRLNDLLCCVFTCIPLHFSMAFSFPILMEHCPEPA